ncbi:hypothetical protein ESCO_004718 [Escovopsis weberi]|uniref:Uncharacterized protein n=1 Tax=Escovopsis weberi TaxID=150374 RepID=A0A0N0RSU6_ESCWE|nr:hypothetical protein ESCO_004718 [Escovopsis weberi]
MSTVYKQFLAEPTSSLLDDNASLHYVTTTTSFSGASEIIKHLSALQKQVKKKSELFINTVEGKAAIAVEIDTSIQFQTSGGVYLPGIDDNFLVTETAQFPITHIVSFNDDGKIASIRQHWDQGSLLKQLNLIGKSGRNWPIRDSKDQLALIQSCLKSSGSPATQTNDVMSTPAKPRAGIPNAMGDPHASLRLFASREEIQAMDPIEVVSPYAGQRPKHRPHTDFLTDKPLCGDADPYRSSPAKAGLKDPQPNRIFDGYESNELPNDEAPKPKLPHIRAHPTKFDHFDWHVSDENNAPKEPPPFAETPYSKRTSQWSFEDFTTPVKSIPSRGMRKQDTFEWDAQANPSTDQPGEPFISKKTNGLSDGSEQAPTSNSGALGNITNTNGRVKDSEPNFTLSDKPPADSAKSKEPKDATQSLIDAVKTLDINRVNAEESIISQRATTENDRYQQQETRIHVAGDGMGGRRGAARDFLFGGGDDVQPHQPMIARRANPSSSQSSLWDI